jgi:hypothetical protein
MEYTCSLRKYVKNNRKATLWSFARRDAFFYFNHPLTQVR